MSVRFRIRTSEGQELSFATHEMFEDFVRSGDLSLEDLVYDAETGSWAPARTHPIVLDIEYEKEAAEEAAAAAAAAEAAGEDGVDHTAAEDAGSAGDGDGSFGLSLAPEQPTGEEADAVAAADVHGAGGGADDDAEAAGDTTDDGGLGLELAPDTALMSPEEAARAFVQKMEAERRDEFDLTSVDQPSMSGFAMEDASAFAALSRAEAPPREEPKREEPKREEPKRAKIARPAAKPKKSLVRRAAALVIGVGLLGGGAWIGLQVVTGGSIGIGAEPPDSVDTTPVDTTPPPPPPRQPIIANTEPAVRERAQELHLTATQVLFRDLPPVPDVWPTGEYLAVPSTHPEVLSAWTAYLTVIRDVRTGDTDRYEAAYEEALDDAVIEGEARTERLTVALADFAALDTLRAGHFDRVEALATAAIQSHNALLGAEGLILYDATGSTGVRSGLGVGTSGRDADAQLLLDQVLDLLSSTLDADGLGPREGSNVREWVWTGYLDAVTH